MAEENKKILLDISINADQFVQKIKQAKDNIIVLKAENRSLNADAQAALSKGLNKQYEEINLKIIENENQLKIARVELSRSQKQFENYTLGVKAAAGSYEQLYQQWKVSEVILKTLEGTLKRNADGTFQLTAEYIRAKKETENAKIALNGFGEGIKDNRLNVGNYAASIEKALNKFPAFSDGLNLIRDAFSGIKTGAQVASEGIQFFSQGTAGLQSSLSTFTDSAYKGANASVNFVKSLVGIKEQVPGVEAVGGAGVAAGTGLTVGANAARIFKLALISTGIGAIVVAVGSLIAYFAKTEKGANLIKVAFAAVGGIVDVVVGAFSKLGDVIVSAVSEPQKIISKFVDFLKGTVFEYIQGLYTGLIGLGKAITGDFSGLAESAEHFKNSFVNTGKAFQSAADGASQFGKDVAKAASSSAKLASDQIELEKALKNSEVAMARQRVEAEKQVAISKDKTKTEAVRVAAANEAIKLENQRIEVEVANSKKREEILQREINLKLQSNSQANVREETNNLKTLQTETLKLEVEKNKRLVELTTERNNIVREERTGRLNAQKTILEAELRQAELDGKETTDLKVRLVRIERDTLLEQENLSTQQKLAIQATYRTKLLEIDRDGFLKRQAQSDQLRDLEVSRIVDNQTREIEAEKTSFERKLREIKGSTEQEITLRKKLTEESLLKQQEIVEKFEKQSLEEKTENLKASVDKQSKEITEIENKKLQSLEVSHQKELNLIQVQIAQGTANQQDLLAAEQAFEKKKYDIKQDAATQQAELYTKYATDRIINDQQFYNNQLAQLQTNLANKLITEEQYIKLKKDLDDKKKKADFTTEIDAVTAANEAINKADELRTQRELAQDKIRTQSKVDSLKAQQAINSELRDSVGSLLGDVASLYAEEAKERKKSAGLFKAFAIGEIIINGEKEIANLFVGASSDTAKTGVYGGIGAFAIAAAKALSTLIRVGASISTVTAQKFEFGGLTGNGKTLPLATAIQQFQPNILNDFQGGMVAKPTMWNLAGEKEPEYVAPGWQLKAQPHIFSMLESWRRTGIDPFIASGSFVHPFADGGFTQSVLNNNIIDVGSLEETLKSGFASIPRQVLVLEDFRTVENRVDVIESRSSI